MKLLKQLFFIMLLVSATSVSVSAQRVLTDEERISLEANSEFEKYCDISVRNHASFTAQLSGVNIATDAAVIKWAKDRRLGVSIAKTGVNDPNLARKCIDLSKGMQFSIGAAPQPSEVIIAAFISANRFGELAELYFAMRSEDDDMTLGTN